ncbi:MAG: arginine--tRNA ligase [Peptostreptococcus sp.]|uniref:arginine--tRNA ligase n=1 Tax=Peptostreptococcus TaxID=1257 RepID=UPI002909F57C|nr:MULTISPECIES: arginine--tRNA ligase [Peptostreptococcus]MDU3422507.1 arginine--tRNA ligase [Peptostreptococcus anaerobius]MDU3429391.1 arginine--tRNA ligase [Peptostreptococcus sp.]MDU3454696.1 arginine--tRNA ligase [Peptostreptococcus sp.]MDU5680487.1 arginine--tRNA ligase [Peptostreptococcus sp.]MDU5737545.1 arginine--tRNA ligase [Peptostreptococcus sp.]
MADFKQVIAESIKTKVEDLTVEEIKGLLEVPPNKEMGDYAFPCFKLAKIFRKAPNMIAEDLSTSIELGEGVTKCINLGGYVNFFVAKDALAKKVITQVFDERENYGKSDLGGGKTVVIDYSSPNIAKPFHIGHIRTTVIGNALYKIYSSQGYKVERINHLGDYGTQFGKLIVAYKLWGDKSAVEAEPIKELLKLYVRFHDEAESKPEMEDEARAWFTRLENNDPEAKELWQWFRDESLKEFQRVYDLLEIDFDSYAGESFYSDKMPAVLEELRQKNLLVESHGTMIVDLEDVNLPPALIQKNDGSTLYITRDLAAAFYRKNTYDFDKAIYVVGSQQELHFKQLFNVIRKMGYDWYKDMNHVQFGMVALEEGTMSTRKGRVVFLEDVLRQAIDKTKEIIMEKNPGAGDIDKIAKEVGVGAVVFQELSNSRIKDYTFSWSRTLSFEGETGPYVQYTHARCCALKRKANLEISADLVANINFDLLSDEDSSDVLKVIETFNKSIQTSMRKNEPHIVTRFVLDLAQAFNKFYHNNPIIVEDKELMIARLALVESTRQTIENALDLLGMKAPERM